VTSPRPGPRRARLAPLLAALALAAPLAAAAVALLSAYLSLYGAAALALARRLAPGGPGAGAALARIGALGSCWMLGELARGWVFTGFPWLSLGYAQVDGPLATIAILMPITYNSDPTGALIMLAAKPLLHILTTDSAVIATTYEMMTYFVPYYFVWSVIEVLSAVLAGYESLRTGLPVSPQAPLLVGASAPPDPAEYLPRARPLAVHQDADAKETR